MLAEICPHPKPQLTPETPKRKEKEVKINKKKGGCKVYLGNNWTPTIDEKTVVKESNNELLFRKQSITI